MGIRHALVTSMLFVGAPAAALGITAPAGVTVRTVATGVPRPTNITVDSTGRMWMTSGGNVTTSSDGVWVVSTPGATPVHVIRGLFTALGLTWFKGELYVSYVQPYSDADGVSHTGTVTAYSGFDGSSFASSRPVLSKVPIGEHTMDTILPGPDGRLYVGVGSMYDAKPSPQRISGSVISMLPSGRDRRIEAHGLRNPYGLAFIPGTTQLLITDNGRDDMGNTRPPDELNIQNVATKALNMGFPGCWGQGGAPCHGMSPPLAIFPPHASADGMAVASSFGAYGLSAFVAQNGSAFPMVHTGNKVVRVALSKQGGRWTGKVVPFASGFRTFDPLGAALGPDGALYVTLWTSGAVVRFVPRRA